MSEMGLWEQLWYYFNENGFYIWEQFVRHFLISIYGVLFAAIVGIPIGFWVSRNSKLADWVIGVANVIQTIPSLAMLSILMLGLGLGVGTVVTTVFLYSLLPIIKNTYTGVRNVDSNILDSGKGMGMTRFQLTYMVELPLSLSVIMAGIRNALVVGIGITAIGTFIGAGGLGDIITRGVNATDGGAIILSGAIPTALMAVISDIVLGAIEKKLDPTNKVRN
ncbi:MAG: ABC transporter permease [Carnobacterium sp.]|uniref:ABC transporter permease n=2 Tax=Carnobacterium TaxID=2747 RepID=A0ABW4NM55_9LACT|nr:MULTISPECIES: ABC transporter permease [unclassified Carnobacterium]